MRLAASVIGLACVLTSHESVSAELEGRERARSVQRARASEQGSQPIPISPAKGSGLLIGRAVSAPGAGPIAGALVTLVPYGELADLASSAPELPPRRVATSGDRAVVTSREGYFVFTGLSAGYYALRASAAGYLQSSYLQHDPGDARVHLLYLKSDEKLGGVDIGLWKLATVSGTVFDETGAPAVGARVRILRRSYWSGRIQLLPVSVALTDGGGSYRVSSLPPGEYVVGVITTLSTIPVSLAERYAAAVGSSSDPSRAPALMTELTNRGVPSPAWAGFRIGDFILQMSRSTGFGYTPPQPEPDGQVMSYASTYFQSIWLPGLTCTGARILA